MKFFKAGDTQKGINKYIKERPKFDSLIIFFYLLILVKELFSKAENIEWSIINLSILVFQ